jgi:putative endonuclease
MKEAVPLHNASRERLARLRRGRFAELTAACLLIAKGYRVLARRHRTPHGEIDVIAARWGRIAFIEVKRRATMADCEAALTPRQAERIGRAADHWLARHARFRDQEIGLDAILVAPGCLPRHLPNALDKA